ncbi:MAG: Rne/Rng family ribonuclease [Thermotogota bacterium]|nr:Rne/Rng family ribonuclease [Thermotogota bacterium]
MERKQKIVFSHFEEEIRIALLKNDTLEEIFFEELDSDSYTGNIYLGRVENVVPSLEAAFVNIGIGKNAFLRFKDSLGKDKLTKNSKVLVQVKKDPMESKGPQVTLKVSIPGRTLVYLPFSKHIGVSRKISDTTERERLIKLAKENLKDNEGVIFRTAAFGVGEETIKEELDNIRKEWKKVSNSYKRSRKPKLLYEEPSLVEYILRERLTETTGEIIIDSEGLWHDVVAGISKFKTGYKPIVRFVEDDAFQYTGLYEKLDILYKNKIPLEGGGNIVIDNTEAMTVVDVNSASNLSGSDISETSINTNLEAVTEIARQLKLRNIGGIVVIDFIDMETEDDQTKIINKFRKELMHDKARSMIMGFTELGLLEMTRKRSNAAIGSKLYSRCPVCHGSGRIESPRFVYQKIVRDLKKNFETDKKITGAEINVYQNLSGVLTPDTQKELSKVLKKTISVNFTWPIPGEYDIKFLKDKPKKKKK